MREIDGQPVAVIVKFSGADASAAVRRWADLLVCEHLALEMLPTELGIAAARSAIRQCAGRNFLEVVRFDRNDAHGRQPLCSLTSINTALLSKSGVSWSVVAEALHRNSWLSAEAVSQIMRLWWFGKLIANTDMHEGNLSFRPGLALAPAYDMLPMLYAPQRGGEVPPQIFHAPLPLPAEAVEWRAAAKAAMAYWTECASDNRISESFRAICSANTNILARAVEAM
jgi:hypothetical protein